MAARLVKREVEKLIKPVINAVLVVDVEKLVFNPGNLFGGLPPPFALQGILPVDRRQAHHSLLPHTPLMSGDRTKQLVKS